MASPVVGKLTPQEAQQLNAEAARGADQAHRSVDADRDGADTAAAAVAIQCRRAEGAAGAARPSGARRPSPRPRPRRKSLIRDLKAYVAADGKGVAGEQFPAFAKWYADNKASRPYGGRRSAPVDRRLRRRQGRRRGRQRGPDRDQEGREQPVAMPGLRLDRGQPAQEHARPSPATTSPASRSGRPTRRCRAPGADRLRDAPLQARSCSCCRTPRSCPEGPSLGMTPLLSDDTGDLARPLPCSSGTHRHARRPGRPSWATVLGVEAHVIGDRYFLRYHFPSSHYRSLLVKPPARCPCAEGSSRSNSRA